MHFTPARCQRCAGNVMRTRMVRPAIDEYHCLHCGRRTDADGNLLAYQPAPQQQQQAAPFDWLTGAVGEAVADHTLIQQPDETVVAVRPHQLALFAL